MSGLKLQRLGLIMEPEPGNPMEVEGVLNPAAVRGSDGNLYLFPRLVAKNTYSRVNVFKFYFRIIEAHKSGNDITHSQNCVRF